MNPIVPITIRGLHDVFSAFWAGGLLVLSLVILPAVLLFANVVFAAATLMLSASLTVIGNLQR